jgi:uncharacterized glyoxalase superfamily protein PhnB
VLRFEHAVERLGRDDGTRIAEIVMEQTDQPYGSRDYAALDLEGNRWSFGTDDPTAV